MIQCQRCSARTQIWLCRPCESDLRKMLLDLPWWINRLAEKALGQTREGESARRSSDLTSPMPVNLTASSHLDTIHAMLVRWVQDLCETNGVAYSGTRMVPRDFIGPLPEGTVRGHATKATNSAAIWLAHNTGAIACDEAAGTCFSDIKNAITLIEAVINRPVPPIECGPCPTLTEDRKACAVGLVAKRGQIEVRCWKCKTTHNIERLIQRRVSEAPYLLFTARDVLKVMARIGLPIGESTWRRWRALGKVQPAGELYGEPGYLLDDVKTARSRNTRAQAS